MHAWHSWMSCITSSGCRLGSQIVGGLITLTVCLSKCIWKLSEAFILRPFVKGLVKKGKSVPLQARSGPEGSRKLRFPNFVTTAQDGGKVVSRMHRPPLPPGNVPGTHFC